MAHLQSERSVQTSHMPYGSSILCSATILSRSPASCMPIRLLLIKKKIDAIKYIVLKGLFELQDYKNAGNGTGQISWILK
jgi:hypothetical protein